ncbi:hypothetical protein SBA6_600013 [Candidatus Sulfopaludibacter sp. SbA6]|nr:hypothetical protein SBA6_600013 [Candidatus Sulfopaludibacter sp. SbA6]
MKQGVPLNRSGSTQMTSLSLAFCSAVTLQT